MKKVRILEKNSTKLKQLFKDQTSNEKIPARPVKNVQIKDNKTENDKIETSSKNETLRKLNEKNKKKYLDRKLNEDENINFKNEESLIMFEKIEKQLNQESSNE